MSNEERRLGAVESKFAELIWENEPITSGNLVRLAEKTLGWKKSTTYTVLKKLSERGIFENEDGTVTSRISKEAFFAEKSEQFVTEAFGGSLPAFVAAFLSQKPLSEEEADEIRRMIDRFRKDG